MASQEEPEIYHYLKQQPSYPNISRLLIKAIADRDFADRLLNDPAIVHQEIPGINLSPQEKEIVLETKEYTYSDIHSFAALIADITKTRDKK